MMKDTIMINEKAGAISSERFNVNTQIDVDDPTNYEKIIIANQVRRIVCGAAEDVDGDDWEITVFLAEHGKSFKAMASVEELPRVFCLTNATDGWCKLNDLGEIVQGWVMLMLNGYEGV